LVHRKYTQETPKANPQQLTENRKRTPEPKKESQDFCLLGFGWGVGVEGGGEKKLLRRGHLELPVFRVACVNDGRAFGFPGRTRFCQVIQGRAESLDCSNRWQQSWPFFRGDSIQDGWPERFHSDP
jgi:hypothetical protein